MAIYIDNGTNKIIAGAHGFTGIATGEDCCCDGPAECPTDCSGLPAYTATVSGITGSSCLTCVADHTGAFSLTRTGCVWDHFSVTTISYITIGVSCSASLWTAFLDFNCWDSGAGCGIFQTISGTIPAKANPTGTYNLTGGAMAAQMVIA